MNWCHRPFTKEPQREVFSRGDKGDEFLYQQVICLCYHFFSFRPFFSFLPWMLIDVSLMSFTPKKVGGGWDTFFLWGFLRAANVQHSLLSNIDSLSEQMWRNAPWYDTYVCFGLGDSHWTVPMHAPNVLGRACNRIWSNDPNVIIAWLNYHFIKIQMDHSLLYKVHYMLL